MKTLVGAPEPNGCDCGSSLCGSCRSRGSMGRALDRSSWAKGPLNKVQQGENQQSLFTPTSGRKDKNPQYKQGHN